LAHAVTNYDFLQADISYVNGDSNPLDVTINGNDIKFTSTTPMVVGAGGAAGHFAGVVTVIYTVTSDKPITGLNLSASGSVSNLGDLGFTELVENWSPQGGSGTVLASTSGNVGGAGLGGSDGPFNVNAGLDFGKQVFSYKVKKTFNLLDLDVNPQNSSVQLDLIDQQAVPEPASLAALALGAGALL